MSKIGLVYWSGTGNTEEMANAFKDAVEDNGGDIYFSSVEQADQEAFLDCDVLVFASPACGTEEINDTDMEPFIDDIAENLDGRKVFLFGSYGWGGGEFMETWTENMEDKGATLVADPITCEGAADDDVLDQLKEVASSL